MTKAQSIPKQETVTLTWFQFEEIRDIWYSIDNVAYFIKCRRKVEGLGNPDGLDLLNLIVRRMGDVLEDIEGKQAKAS